MTHEDSKLKSHKKNHDACILIRKPLRSLNSAPFSALVGISARCSIVGTYSTEIVYGFTESQTKRNSTSVCLVLAELRGLLAQAIATSLSTKASKHFSARDGTTKDNTDFANSASLTPSPSATYLVSVVERVTIYCVLLPQLITDFSRVTTTPVTDLLPSAFSA